MPRAKQSYLVIEILSAVLCCARRTAWVKPALDHRPRPRPHDGQATPCLPPLKIVAAHTELPFFRLQRNKKTPAPLHRRSVPSARGPPCWPCWEEKIRPARRAVRPKSSRRLNQLHR